MTPRELPRGVRALLSLSLPEDWRADIMRDLGEAWGERHRAGGAVRARLWLWSQALLFSMRFTPERLRDFAANPGATSADLKLALRSVSRSPMITLLGVVSLGVGIGAAVSGYTIIQGALFVDLPFPGGDRIVLVSDYDDHNRYMIDLSAAEYSRRQQELESYGYYEAFFTRQVVVGDPEESAAVVLAIYGTPGLLAMTETQPMMGRLPHSSDTRPGAEPVVVLAHSKWVALTGSDRQVIGTQLEIGGVRRTVIGVMPEGFGFPWADDMWIPIDARDADAPLRVIAKLHEGVTKATARAELAAVAVPELMQAEDDAKIIHVVTDVAAPVVSPSSYLVILIPIGILLALIAVMAANVANLVVARNARRASELAVRRALGGSRRRIVGQLAFEVVGMVALAAGAGIALSRYVAYQMTHTVGTELPIWTDFSLRWEAVILAVVLGGLVTLIAGVGPGLRATAVGPADALRDRAGGSGGVRFGRLTGALIVTQVAVCVGFLSAATLLGQSLLGYSFERYALPESETLVAQIYFGWPEELRDGSVQFAEEERERIRARFMEDATRKRHTIREEALALGGVRQAAYASRFPGNETEKVLVEIEGFDEPMALVESADVDDGFFDLMGVEPTLGRAFRAEEHADALPVIMVNRSFVRDRLRGANPIGRRLRVVPQSSSDPSRYPWSEIVGVVPDIGLNPGNPSNAAAVFTPLPETNIMRLALRGEADPNAWTPMLIDLVRNVDSSIRVQWTQTLENQLRQPVIMFKALGIGSLVMGLLALLLSAASIHALTACAVAQRTREIGIRQALGAGTGRVVGEVLKRSALQLGLGLVLGSGIAWGLVMLTTMWPWEVRQSNPAALVAVAGVLTLSGVLALAAPLRRALGIRPADAMRVE